ncbi:MULTISPECIES: RagB/SusD family nutrient uptake outer membrane protein [Elizabethkingia]|uniref:RagB/SusD family nutrient uptake outer membrane protein n=1 Tax=Elizabethkingia TaxID=308865 RepID=UPI001C88EEC2|nr:MULTISPECIES: RagB/SusD family nutrient uptake outer membrane protein [Elizabethkingia]
MKKIKTNKIYKITAVLFLSVITLGTLSSCSTDNITDVQNKGAFDSENFYQNRDQAFQALVATYDPIGKYASSTQNMIIFLNAASDDFYSGGGSGSDGVGVQGFANYSIDPIIMPQSYWNIYFQGISRANTLIEKLPEIPMDANEKARFNAEALTLRSMYYFELLRMFKNIPLILKSVKASDNYFNIPQEDPKKVYQQIENDMLAAIPVLPVSVPTGENGRLTQGAAKALLGKIYLYDGKKDLAAAQFADVNGAPGGTSQYGYKLLTNFNNLWDFKNKFNSESVFELVCTSNVNATWAIMPGQSRGNIVSQMVGPRSFGRTDAGIAAKVRDIYTGGWGFNTVTEDLFNFMQGDPRMDATIYNAKKLKEDGYINYVSGYKDTGYFLNKFLPTQADRGTGGGNVELNFAQDFYIIRLADTYLMEAEALNGSGARAQALLDAVRQRVGLSSVPVSMQAIKDERRRELAGEGHRWFDLVRWGDAPIVLGNKGFKPNKNEILPIPYKELINTVIKQNPGY